MLIAGSIAFAQVLFLPGFITLQLIRFRDTLASKLLSAFALSLMINYWIIFFLAAAHVYTIIALGIILVCEMCMLFLINRNGIRAFFKHSPTTLWSLIKTSLEQKSGLIQNWFRIQRLEPSSRLFLPVTLLLVFFTFAYILYLFATNIGTVFNLWDPIVSWNRWAVEWSMNALPRNTWEYPQLIPANWSIFYISIGAPIQYFAKAIMPLFPLGIITALLSSGIRKKSLGYIAAIPATVLFMRLMNGSGIMATEGYVDSAVAFFSFISILSLLNVGEANTLSSKLKMLLIGGLFALGAAMTKQSGLITVAIFPILAWIVAIKNNPELKKRFWKHFFIYVGLAIFLLGPFYIYKELSIASNGDTSVVPAITNLIYGEGRGALQVTADALYFCVTKTYGIFLLFTFLLFFAWRDKKYRPVIVLALIPYTLIWALFFSYDSRNLSLAMPLWGLSAGIGLEQFAMRFRLTLDLWFSKVKIIWIILLALILCIAVSPFVSRKIAGGFVRDEREIYDRELSVLISNYFDTRKDAGQILTNFPILYFLPATRDRMYSPFGGYDPNADNFSSYKKDSASSKVAYIFAASYTDSRTLDDIDHNISSGKYSLVFRRGKDVLVKTNNIEL